MRTASLLCVAASAALLASCTSGKLAIRAVGSSSLAEAAPASERVAEGNAQLALGNVGLAIETFRKALRDDPGSIDAYAGMAAGYERMGRFDLAAMQLERALALQPDSLDLLERLAANLQAEGQSDKANAVRREMAMRATLERDGVPEVSAVAKVVAIDERLALSAPTLPVAVSAPRADSPRLVRLSRGEIALVTGPGPLWEKAVAAAPRSVRSHQIELLNAAKVQRLAARTRQVAIANGWSNVSVGNAAALHKESVVLFPASARLGAARLAAQFGFKSRLDPARSHITVILGEDAARLVNGSANGA